MIKIISSVLAVIFIVGCSFYINKLYAGEVCDIKVAKKDFTDLIFTGPITIDEVISIYDKEVAKYQNKTLVKNWLEFREEAKNSGCVFAFTSSQESWNSLSGTKGFALVRGEKIVNIFITVKS